MAPIAAMSLGAAMEQMQMNFVTCFLCCREAVRKLKPAGGGRIVNVAARPAIEPRLGGGMTAYAASKAAVAVFTQALAEEVAAERIWVNAVAPSIIDTPANREAMPKADYGRWPKPSEIAATIVYLASPANGATRGAVLSVYGAS
jgi:NAD(P)-dependent dehydrogenase (short-subunit alcohol dehydrogenase family)